MRLSILIAALVFCQLFVVGSSHACSCSNIPETFSKNIHPEYVIFSCEVVDHINFFENGSIAYETHGLTKLLVTQWHQNKMTSDTMYFKNGSGASCGLSLEGFDIGQGLVLKSRTSYLSDPALWNVSEKEEKAFEPFLGKQVVSNIECDRCVLKLDEQYAIGDITKNLTRRKYKHVKRIEWLSKKWAEKIRTKHRNEESRFQQMSIQKFNRLMRRKCKAL